MTATDELRQMLDERGVFWIDVPLVGMKRTCWKSSDKQDGYCYFDEDEFGVTELTISQLTPAQAIAATLGTGACHMERDFTRWDDDDGYYVTSYTCSVCADSYLHIGNGKPKACPNCGRRIEVEE